MERLFLYYTGIRKMEVRDKLVREIDGACIDDIDANSIVANYSSGMHKTARKLKAGDCSIWMHGIYVHAEKGVGPCIDDAEFGRLFGTGIEPENIPAMFVNGAYCGLVLCRGSVSLFNDFMGLQPMYIYQSVEEIIVCSSFRFILKLVEVTINYSAITEYVLTGNNYSLQTAAKEIKCLSPASLIKFGQHGQYSVTQYDRFSEQAEVRSSMTDVLDEISALFVSAVKRLYDGRIIYSMSITGGIDSRLIYLEWPDKNNLLTETAGKGSSDFIKARQIIERIGNPDLHELEDHKSEKYAEGLDIYYRNCDNPLRITGDFNAYHLEWKKARGSFLHISGVGGELLDGENLYLSRSKKYVIREAFRPYDYHELRVHDKPSLIANVLGSSKKTSNLNFLQAQLATSFDFEEITKAMDKFIGVTKFQECYTERFRTYHYANAGFNLSGSQNLASYLTIMPYNDSELVKAVCKYHPSTRELRKLTIEMLRRYPILHDIPVDTTHLKINSPYYLHRFFRVLRMVLSIGYHKKIPLIQKGDPPKFRAFPYFDPKQHDFREMVNRQLTACDCFDRETLKGFIDEINSIQGYNFYIRHGAQTNIMILLRLSYLYQMLGK